MLIEQWSQDLWHHTVIHSVKLSRMVTFCLRKVSLPVLSCPITCRFPLSFLFINYSLSLPSSLLFIAPYLFFLWSVYFTEFRLLEKNADGASSELVYQLFLFLMFGQMNRGNGAIKLLLCGDGNKNTATTTLSTAYSIDCMIKLLRKLLLNCTFLAFDSLVFKSLQGLFFENIDSRLCM